MRTTNTFTTTRMLDRSKLSMRRLAAASVTAATLALAPASLTHAETQTERGASAGWEQEEWYDPTDWFDDEFSADGAETTYYQDWDSYYEAYYDGYYDGYTDIEFGYDYWDPEWTSEYASAYSDGYYDGYYDDMNEYVFDPTYYVVTWSPADSPDNAERSSDQSRSRGDRTDEAKSQSKARASKTSSASKSDRKKMNRDAQQKRVRGTVTKISHPDRSGKSEQTLLKLGFEDRDAVVASFGPKMSREDLPFETGDRVTLTGRMKKHDGRRVLEVHSISHDGQTHTLRGKRKPSDDAMASAR